MNYAAAARCNVPCKCGVPECGVEFAFEIGSGLLAEVRRLQGLLVERDAFIAQQDSIIAGRDTIIADQDGLLAERDKIIQDMKEEKADLKKSVESLRAALAKQTAALRTQLPVVSPAESVPSVTDPLASQIASLRIADTAKSEVDRANSVAGEIKVTPETAEFKHTPALRQRLLAITINNFPCFMGILPLRLARKRLMSRRPDYCDGTIFNA
ncbi:hypothetical protein DFH06DRAFT_1336262 [Mycena polygramma]|nr:hypothetical protein DFH06DRAFT_1336262 [Mycena polygramma]